jgi:predicted dehydrogenase
MIPSITRRTFSLMAASAPLFAQSEAKPVRAAMIGTGHGHANSKVRALRSIPSCEFVGVCRPDAKDPIRGDLFASVTWLKLPQILDDTSIEMVAIEGADPKWNLEYAWRAVNAGKHVHLDKPPGDSYTGLRDLLAEAGRRGTQVQMGYQWRYHPAMQAVMDAARKGWLGQIYRFRASIDKPILADERKELAHYAGGMMFSEGCHLIDRATALLGEPRKVQGFLHHRSSLDDGLIDNALAVLEYDNAIAEISMAGFDPNGNEHRYLEVLGTNGFARVQPYSPLRLHTKLKEAAGPYPAGVQTLEAFAEMGYPYVADFLELIAAIRHGKKLEYSPSHDLMTHRVLLEVCGMWRPA